MRKVALIAPILALLFGCGGSGEDKPDAPAVFRISTATLPVAYSGMPFTVQIATENGVAPVTFAWADGFVSPVWVSISASGELTGTPPTAGTTNLQIKATDSSPTPAVATRTLALVAYNLPAITSTSLARGVRGQVYNASVTATAPPGVPFTFAISSGTLPAGVSMSANGVFTGTPTAAALHVLMIEMIVNSAVADSREFDLVINESIPYTYVPDANEPNNNTATSTQLAPGATPPGRLTMATPIIQATPLTVTSNLNAPTPDPSDFFRFNIGNVGTITIDVFYRYFVGEVDAYLWFYEGPPNHSIVLVAKSMGIQVDDERIVYHNAQLSAGMGVGYYYLEVNAPGDSTGFWNNNAYTFKIGFNDLTIASSVLDADSPGGATFDVPVVAFNAGLAPTAPVWSLVSGALPPGVAFTTDGRFIGSTNQFGIQSFTVQVRDGALVQRRDLQVRFFDSLAGGYWQVRGERRLFNGTSNPLLETFGDAIVVAPHPDYPVGGAIYVLGGRTETDNTAMVRVFHTNAAGIPAAKHFHFEDIAKPLPVTRRYHSAAYLQHSYGGYIYVVGGEVGAAVGVHSIGDFYYGVERLMVADGFGVPLPHPLPTSWESVASLPQTEAGRDIKGWAEGGLGVVDAAADTDDRIYLVGGMYQIEDTVGGGIYNIKFHNAVLMLECPVSAVDFGTWHRKSDANPYTPVRYPAVHMLDGRIYMIGGRAGVAGQVGSGGPPLTTIQMVQPSPVGTTASLATGQTSQYPQLTEGTYYPLSAVLNGAIYVWGGWDANPAALRRLHRYTPNAATGLGGTMLRMVDMDFPTGFTAGVAFEGKLWTISGFSHGLAAAPSNLCFIP